MNLNIDNYGGRSIVPVRCGNYVCGTAFFVSSTRLLTARHLLSEYILDNTQPVAIIVEGDHKPCRVVYIGSDLMDVAVLECVDYTCPDDFILPLLACRFKAGIEAVIIGFPIELGNGVDYFGVTVKNSREKSNLLGGFDRMVVRTDSFGFSSYVGFSGSPVINEFGMVVGIETDQLYNTLGYVSIAAIKDAIREHIDAQIETNDDLYDNSDFGIRRCINFALDHTKSQLKTRFNELVHVENISLQRSIEFFCGYGFEEYRNRIYQAFKVFYGKLVGKRKAFIDGDAVLVQYLQDGQITDEAMGSISAILYENDTEKSLPPDYRKELRTIRNSVLIWQRGKNLYDEQQFLCIMGTAGSGKSHILCREALTINQKCHVYMFLGSEFSALESPLACISRLLGWQSQSPLDDFNRELLRGGRKATIIIDALNEGAGTHYWAEQLPLLKSTIERYSQLKLIVSLRTLSQEDKLNNILREWDRHLEVEGFVNREKALKDYFNAYHISDDTAPYASIEEFSNPLFLKMFCETYYSQTEEERRKVLRLPIYRRYLQKRNQEVSAAVDEDPKQDVTTRYINWVAQRSLEQFQCDDLPRQLAFRRSRRLCPYRSWTQSLLRNFLSTNLLREYSTPTGDFIDFEFDSMGDYLKAAALLERKCDDGDRLRTLLRINAQMNIERKERNGKWEKKYNFIQAFLSLWNPPQAIWLSPSFVGAEISDILLASLNMRNVRDDGNTLTEDVVSQLLQHTPDFYTDPEVILQNIGIYTDEIRHVAHDKLKGMTLAERDLSWTTKVNALYSNAFYKELFNSLHPTLPHEIYSSLWVETWMLSTSFPYLRAYIIRRLKALLVAHPGKTAWVIDQFHDVNDSYILSGLYAAIYGVVVSVDSAEYSRSVSEKMYTCHYDGDGLAPQDLMVRHWTLKIFELAYHQDRSIDYWEKAQPPYAPTEDLFAIMPQENYEADGYFGETYGSKQITHSLFHWDFSRYIIGTNSNNASRVFFLNGQAVLLKTIENAIAYLIKHQYGWNDELGKYDDTVPYQTSYENNMERIGKKYQWMGLYRVYAYLCDICQMKINLWSTQEGFAGKNYPWYAPERNYFDPTLNETDDALRVSHQLFDVIHPASTLQHDAHEWLKDERQMPQLYFMVHDKQGRKWVVLHAYSTVKEPDGDSRREQFVFYNGTLVKSEDYDHLRSWASTKNFYGRWMPEHRGSIDYHWNEFPWADSYKILEQDDTEVFNEGGCDMLLAYSAQLQEDYRGMEDDAQHLSTAYMPCKDMMEVLGLHTAERGIVRDAQGEVAAICRYIPDEPLHALLIRRDRLDSYLREKGYVLFWPLIGEKQYGTHVPNFSIERLTGAAAYRPGEDVDVMQPFRKEPPAPPRKRPVLQKEDFPTIPQALLDQMNEMDEEELLRMLSEGLQDDVGKD